MAVFQKNNNGGAKKVQDAGTSSFNFIVSGTLIKGDIEANGDIRIDGSLKGNLHSKAKLVLGENALIEGDIYCQNADISGRVLGNIYVEDLLTLKTTANVKGNVNTQKLVVEVGAVFNGNCKMSENAGTADSRETERAKGREVLAEA